MVECQIHQPQSVISRRWQERGPFGTFLSAEPERMAKNTRSWPRVTVA